jgi:anti-anti-sigma factor
MFSFIKEENRITIKMSSDMGMIDRTITRLEEELTLGMELRVILRELLSNAIEHGNQNKPEKHVQLTMEDLHNDRYSIVVKDEGDGFEYNPDVLIMKDGEDGARERGLAMVNRFADELRFDNQGSMAMVWYTTPKKTKFEIMNGEREVGVVIQGAIGSTNADELRRYLLQSLEQEPLLLYLDFEKVTDIDSMGVSVLLSFAHAVKQEEFGPEVEIRNVSEELKALLDFTQVNKMYALV